MSRRRRSRQRLRGRTKAEKKPQPIQRLRNNIKSVRNIIEIQVSKLAPKEMTALLEDMESLALLVRQELDRQSNETMRISAKKETAAMVKAAAATRASSANPDAQTQIPAEQAPSQEQTTTVPEPVQPSDEIAETPAVELTPPAKKKAKTTAKKKKPAKKEVLL
jgi:hypothetical protein